MSDKIAETLREKYKDYNIKVYYLKRNFYSIYFLKEDEFLFSFDYIWCSFITYDSNIETITYKINRLLKGE